MSLPTFDWCSFFALFWNDKGLRCKVNIPDTVLFRYGQLSAWWATNKEGYIQRHASQYTAIESIRKRCLQVASDDEANYTKYVAITRSSDGRPQLLRLQAFNQLCELLSDRLEAGRPASGPELDSLSVLQAHIQPHNNARYITTYTNNGSNISCHTFQRAYSRRYMPAGVVAAAAGDIQEGDIIMGDGADAQQQRHDIDAVQGAVDPSLKMQLRKITAHIVNYIQRAHGLTLGGIVCEYIRDFSGKIYLLSVLRTEWASNGSGHGAGSLAAATLLEEPLEEPDEYGDWQEQGDHASAGMAEVPPASAYLPSGAAAVDRALAGGGASVVAAGLSSGSDVLHWSPVISPESGRIVAWAQAHTAVDSMPAWQSASVQQTAAQAASQAAPALSHATAPSPVQVTGSVAASSLHPAPVHISHPLTAKGRPSTAPAASMPVTPAVGGAPRSNLAAYPGGTRGARLGLTVGNSWPSLQHETMLSPKPAGPHEQGTAAISFGTQRPIARSQSARPAVNHGSMMADRKASMSSAGQGSQWGQPPTRPATARQGSPASRPGTGHVNSGVRGAPLMLQQLTHEVESLRDQLLYQHTLAEASASKVRSLEAEREVVLGQFQQRMAELESSLAVCKEDLAAAKHDRDEHKQRADSAEARASSLESQLSSALNSLDSERGTLLASLRDYQERDADMKARVEQMESEVLRLSERLREETTAVNALKRQLLEYSHIAEKYKNTLKDAEFEAGMADVMDMIESLFSTQANPHGETYAVQKVLHHYHADLRAVFLYYAQLEQSFTQHWPPSMTFTQFMLFCKDTETADPRVLHKGYAQPGMRTGPSHPTLHPEDCEEVFRSYAAVDLEATGPGLDAGHIVLRYESFLACIVDLGNRLRRKENPFLSEATRDFILRYISRAHKVSPQGLKKGVVRDAIEGTKVSSGKKRGKSSRSPTPQGNPLPSPSRPLSAASRSSPVAGGKGLDSAPSTLAADMALLGINTAKEVIRRGGGFHVQDVSNLN